MQSLHKKLPIIVGVILLLLLIIIIALFRYFESDMPSSKDFDCGKLLSLSQYENYTKEQLDLLYESLINGEKNQQLKHHELSKGLSCFAHKDLPSQGYFLSKQTGHKYMLQAVHAHDDLHTGELTKALMQMSDTAQIASISSVRRKLLDPSNQATLSNALAVKLIENSELKAVIQLHGFSNLRRKTRKAKAADFIISSGDKGSHLLANNIYQCLQHNFDNTYLFGKNIYELGATENFLSQALQDKAYAENFVHIEISLPQRKKLLQPLALKQFAECLSLG